MCVYNICIYIYTHTNGSWIFAAFSPVRMLGVYFGYTKNARFSSWMRHTLHGFPTSMQLCYPSNLESPFSGVIIGRGV